MATSMPFSPLVIHTIMMLRMYENPSTCDWLMGCLVSHAQGAYV
jgi:hypothetical protein